MASDHDPIRLTDEQLRLLGQWCAQTGKTAEELIADALRSYKPSKPQASNGATIETLFDRLSRHGLLGCLMGGPADLSTGPEHMKGFGE